MAHPKSRRISPYVAKTIFRDLLQKDWSCTYQTLQFFDSMNPTLSDIESTLSLHIPQKFAEWEQTLHHITDDCDRFVWIWLLCKLAEMKVNWALSIKELTLERCELLRLPWNIGALKNLVLLDVSINSLYDLPESLQALSKLQKLYLHDNQFIVLPSWLSSLDLDLLYVVGNPLRQMPLNAKSLTLMDDMYDQLVDQLPYFTNLRHVLLQTRVFPEDCQWLIQQPHLETLEVHIATIAAGVTDVWKCTQLKALSFMDVYFLRIPDEIVQMTRLEKLTIEGTDLRSLPSKMGRCLPLKHLSIRGSSFKRVPPCVKHLVFLEYLELSCCEIRQIPKWLTNLKQLECLNLHKTEVSVVPEGILHLELLKKLVLSETNITTFPEWMRYMIHLDVLDIRNTGIPFSEILRLQFLLPQCQILF